MLFSRYQTFYHRVAHIGQTLKRPYGNSEAARWRILFFGSDDFSLPHLKTLWDHHSNGRIVKDLAVVTMKNNKDIQRYSQQQGLECHFWPVSAERLTTLNFDLGVLVSFGHLIPEDIISTFPKGVVNVHPSLLPRWQGAAPLLHTVLAGDTTTGVSVIRLKPHRFDRGPILHQNTLDLEPGMTSDRLRVKMAAEGSLALTKVLSDLDQYLSEEREQDLMKATLAPKLTLGHANVNWNDTAEQIDRQYRTLGPLFNLRSKFKGIHCRLMKMEPLANIPGLLPTIEQFYPGREFLPGEQCFLRKRQLLCIKCQDGWVAFGAVAVKKPMTSQEFYNGYLSNDENLRFDSLDHGLEQFNHWKVCGT